MPTTPIDRVPWMPESHDARVTERGKPQTGFWRAFNVANRSLVEYEVEPEPPKERSREEWMQRLYRFR